MNNKYFLERCPAIMNNNNRHFVLNSDLNKDLCKELKCTNEHDYRKLLQENAESITQKDKNKYNNMYPCNVSKM